MPRRRPVRGLGLLVLALGLTLVGLGAHLTRPHRLTRLASELLTAMTGAEARIRRARIRWDGSIVLQNVTLRVADLPEGPAQLFDADQVVVRHSLLALLGGSFMPRTLTFINPTLHVTEREGAGYNYQKLTEARSSTGSAGALEMPDRLPEIYIRRGRILFGQWRDGQFQVNGQMAVSGNLSADARQNGEYYFALRQALPDGSAGPALTGDLNLKTLSVNAELSGLTFDDPQRHLLPPELRRWWDQLDPTGSVPMVRLGYQPSAAEGAKFYAHLELRDIALTLPYTESSARMSVRSGRITFDQRSVRFNQLTGQIEGLTYTINGQVDGYDAAAPLRLSARIVGAIPDQPRYVPWFPPAVQEQFGRFSPAGQFQADVLVTRQTAGGRFSYDGRLELRDAKLRYWQFPYPLDQVKGELRFNDEEIRLESFHGQGPTGAKISVRGRIAPPGPGAQVDMYVTGVGVPLDQALYEAIKPGQQRSFDDLFNREAYARLTDLQTGALLTPTQQKQLLTELSALEQTSPASDSEPGQRLAQVRRLLRRPVYELGGTVNVRAHTQREPGDKRPYVTTVEYELTNVNLLLRQWPYPLRLTGGKFIAGPEGATIEQATLTGLTGGTGTLTGGYTRQEIEGRMRALPQIKFVAINFPIDDVLYAALPSTAGKIVRELNLTGEVDAGGLIFADENANLDFLVDARVPDATARPFGGRYDLQHVQGQLTLRPGDVRINDFTAKHNDTRVTFAGKFGLRSPQDEADLTFTLHNLRLEDPVADLLSAEHAGRPALLRLLEGHRAAGYCDAQWSFTRKVDQAGEHRLTVSPRELSFDMRGQRIALTEMAGSLSFVDQVLSTSGLTASYGTGKLQVQGTLDVRSANPLLDVVFSAQNQEICTTTCASLPSAVTKAISALEMQGAYQVQDAHLKAQLKDGQLDELELRGPVLLQQARATLGAPITELDGRLEMDVRRASGAPWPTLNLTLQAERLRAVDRLLAPVTARFTSDPQTPALLHITDLTGQAYGGKLLGSGQVDLADGGRFEVELTLLDAAMQGIVSPRAEPKSDDQAVLSANLRVAGLPDDISTRRGRGEITIRKARMYELPLTLTVLQLLNLSAPLSRSFDAADVHFLLDGDLVPLELVRISSPTLDVEGNGAMRYSTRELDLDLVTRNRSSPRLGPVGELIQVVKDEVLTIHVTGTLDQPRSKLTPLDGVRRSIRRVFRGDREQPGLNGNGAVGDSAGATAPQSAGDASTSRQ